MLNPKLINCNVEPDPIEYLLPIWTRHFESYCRFTLLAKNVAGMPLINPFCVNRPCEIEELVRSGAGLGKGTGLSRRSNRQVQVDPIWLCFTSVQSTVSADNFAAQPADPIVKSFLSGCEQR